MRRRSGSSTEALIAIFAALIVSGALEPMVDVKRVHVACQLRCRNDAVDEAHDARVIGGKPIGREEYLLGKGRTDDINQPLDSGIAR